MRQELIDTIGNGFTAFFQAWGNVFSNFGSWFMSTPLGYFIDFAWGVVKFIFYAGRSIYYLVINLFQTIVNGTSYVSYYLGETFDGLGVFLGINTSTLVTLFQLTLILIVFGFIVRVILGKFHYNVKTKK